MIISSSTGVLPVNRLSTVVTNSYVAGAAFPVDTVNQVVLYIDFTKGSLTSMQVKVEFASTIDGAYFQETFAAISGGSSTETLGEHSYAADGKYRLAIPVKDAFCKVSVKGTGTVTSSLVAVYPIIGVV